MDIIKINHLELRVTNLDISELFYDPICDFLEYLSVANAFAKLLKENEKIFNAKI